MSDLKPCPFCGSRDIFDGPLSTDCRDCHASAPSNDAWNAREGGDEALHLAYCEGLTHGYQAGVEHTADRFGLKLPSNDRD